MNFEVVHHHLPTDDPGVSAAIVITPKSERRSSLYLTRFEMAKIIGERARQISSNNMLESNTQASADLVSSFMSRRSTSSLDGSSEPSSQKWTRTLVGRSPAFVAAEKTTNPLSRAVDPVMIAKHELVEHRISLILKRTFPDGRSEFIPVQELEVDPTLLDLKY